MPPCSPGKTRGRGEQRIKHGGPGARSLAVVITHMAGLMALSFFWETRIRAAVQQLVLVKQLSSVYLAAVFPFSLSFFFFCRLFPSFSLPLHTYVQTHCT
jgi:hypothetical protein